MQNSLNINLEYNKESWIYQVYSYYSEKNCWTLPQIYYLLLGENPDKKSQKIKFFNKQKLNADYLFKLPNIGHEKDENGFLRPKEGDYRIKPNNFDSPMNLGEYLDDLKDGNDLYDGKKVLERIDKHTKITLPQILIDLGFGKKHEDEKQIISKLEKENYKQDELIYLLSYAYDCNSDAPHIFIYKDKKYLGKYQMKSHNIEYFDDIFNKKEGLKITEESYLKKKEKKKNIKKTIDNFLNNFSKLENNNAGKQSIKKLKHFFNFDGDIIRIDEKIIKK